MTDLDRTELDRLRDLAEVATPGEWEASERDLAWQVTQVDAGPYTDAIVPVGYWWGGEACVGASEPNSAFIAYANPERVTRLVGLVEELTAFVHDYMHEGGAVADGLGERARVLLDRLGAA